jgi:hypothetical protein
MKQENILVIYIYVNYEIRVLKVLNLPTKNKF